MRCPKCTLHYQTVADMQAGVRCRCFEHCPCHGLCSGLAECPCEPIRARLAAAALGRLATCACCGKEPEARKGARLCLLCLKTAALILNAIEMDAERAAAGKPPTP